MAAAPQACLLPDPLLPPVRVTRDVDVITEASSRLDYHQLDEALRKLGFSPDMRPDAAICRWCIGDLILDLMPTDEAILGFTNRWYTDALATATTILLPSGQPIRTLTPPHFLGTKFEAFHGRGQGDYWASHDMEDIVCVIDGRAEIVAEVAASSASLRQYLQADPMFAEAVSGFLSGKSNHWPRELPSRKYQRRLSEPYLWWCPALKFFEPSMGLSHR